MPPNRNPGHSAVQLRANSSGSPREFVFQTTMASFEKHHRRWYQYSVRTLLALMVALNISMSWFAARMQRANRQRAAVDSLYKTAGSVEYDKAELSQPRWVRHLLGDDFFRTVVVVHDDHMEFTDAGLEQIKGMTGLRELWLIGSSITDAGLEHVEGLTQLQVLRLGFTQITDGGLRHLERLTQLRELTLGETRVTDAGLHYLEGLNRLEVLDLSGTQITDAGLEHLERLSGLRSLGLGASVSNRGIERIKKALPNCACGR